MLVGMQLHVAREIMECVPEREAIVGRGALPVALATALVTVCHNEN